MHEKTGAEENLTIFGANRSRRRKLFFDFLLRERANEQTNERAIERGRGEGGGGEICGANF